MNECINSSILTMIPAYVRTLPVLSLLYLEMRFSTIMPLYKTGERGREHRLGHD